MDIIFVTLPSYLDWFSILIKKLGYPVYYLNLSNVFKTKKEAEIQRIERLKIRGIVPLPIEDIPHFEGFSELDTDPYMIAFRRTEEIAPVQFLQSFGALFPQNKKITKKLQIAVHSAVALQQIYCGGRINIWARSNPNKKILLLDISLKCLLNPRWEPNVRLVVLPLEIFENGFRLLLSFSISFLNSVQKIKLLKKKTQIPTDWGASKKNDSRVAFVTHQGLKYGDIFQKDLFYSARPDSDLYPERILHFDYCGISCPAENLIWVCFGDQNQLWIKKIYFGAIALFQGIPHIRHPRNILGLLILTNFYVGFRSYAAKLDSYPDLKIALIDYDVLCPKDLLLAFESKNIKTVATQERYLSTFSKLFASVILDYYLCSSDFAAKCLEKSPIICVDHYIPVGQYRSDNLIKMKQSAPPKIFMAAKGKGQKIITVLGYHTQMDWEKSRIHPLINWSAHKHFLTDIIQLSSDIPDAFFVLRYKEINWMSLPIFNETLQKIQSIENLVISTDYDKDFISYDLCAHSDLIIAKYTSLADECLSAGIPVLFHEYTHNTNRIISDAFDYSPAKIMCYSYQELLGRSKRILDGSSDTIIHDYYYLKNVIYGGLGDGMVKKRIHREIEKIISEM